ncbi:MAG: hypothetical protein GY844_01500 [Bradyrhizobium sp.]|nr:hypothetical protein [Bradyrhizobium sp.]
MALGPAGAEAVAARDMLSVAGIAAVLIVVLLVESLPGSETARAISGDFDLC